MDRFTERAFHFFCRDWQGKEIAQKLLHVGPPVGYQLREYLAAAIESEEYIKAAIFRVRQGEADIVDYATATTDELLDWIDWTNLTHYLALEFGEIAYETIGGNNNEDYL